MKRIAMVCGAALLTVHLCVGNAASARGVPAVIAPKAMAAVGDSLSSGYPGSASGSWTTGSTVKSHASRLKKLYSSFVAYNFAQPGAPVASFEEQAKSVVKKKDVGYVTVMFGGNDVCNPVGGVATSLSVFRQRFAKGLEVLSKGLPGVKILVVSLPNLQSALSAMLAAGRSGEAPLCSRFYANPASTDQVDVSRRAKVMSEIKYFNYEMARECAKVKGCRTDQMAFYKHMWKSAEIGSDGLHPSAAGHAMIASITWAAGFKWSSRN